MKGLFITYYYPPKNSIASFRTYAINKYFNASDIKLDLICPEWEGDLKLEEIDCKKYFTHKIQQQKESGVYENKLRGFIVKNVLYRFFKYNLFRDIKPGLFYSKAVEILKNIDLNQYDFVLTSYGPYDVLHIGNYIKSKNTKLKWFIDYRDVFSLFHYNKYGVYLPYFKEFEKRLTKKADSFFIVSDVLKKKQEKLLRKSGEVIYNGFDEIMVEKDEKFEAELTNFNLPIVSYTGSLYNGERDVSGLLNYIKSNGLDSKFSFVFALLNTDDEMYLKRELTKFPIKNIIIYRNLSFNQSMLLQKYSKLLLLLANTDGKGDGYLTGKVFEYMYWKKPILYSGTTGNYELYTILKTLNIGEHYAEFSYSNPQYNFDGIDKFNRKMQIGRMIEIVRKELSKK